MTLAPRVEIFLQAACFHDIWEAEPDKKKYFSAPALVHQCLQNCVRERNLISQAQSCCVFIKYLVPPSRPCVRNTHKDISCQRGRGKKNEHPKLRWGHNKWCWTRINNYYLAADIMGFSGLLRRRHCRFDLGKQYGNYTRIMRLRCSGRTWRK